MELEGQMLRMVDDLFKIVKDPDWKPTKTVKNVNIFRLKMVDTNGLLMYKFEGTLPFPWKLLFDLLRVPQNVKDMWHDPNYTGKLEIFTDKENFKEYKQEWNFPFPLANRDTVFTQWDYSEPTRGVIVSENMKREVPRKKGYVRTKLHMCGFIMEQAPNPSESLFTHVFCLDCMGSMPTWMMNKITGDYHNNIQRLIKSLTNNKK
jgi:hypothetical protein